MVTETFEGYLSPSQAARLVGVDAGTLKYHATTGRLPVVIVPPGRRLYRTEDVQELARWRAEKRNRNG